MKVTAWRFPVLLLLFPPLSRSTVDEPESPPRVQPLLEATEPRDGGSARCRLPSRVGPCRASFPRFFYDVSSQTCVSFIYGGCEKNDNNFETEEACLLECSGVSGDLLPDERPAAPPAVKTPRMASEDAAEAVQRNELCEAEPEAGPCRAAFPRWFYNWKTGSCQSFIYGGCHGNKNNYLTEDSCMSRCAVGVSSSSKTLADEDEEFCSATPDPGPCRAAFPMYYYDRNSATCQFFLYGGCQGNPNRFGTVEECLRRCGFGGDFRQRDQSRRHSTAAVFLFVTLAVVSVLLLASLLLATWRRFRLPLPPSSFSDKEELLPEDRSSLDLPQVKA